MANEITVAYSMTPALPPTPRKEPTMNASTITYRQGDVALRTVSKIPACPPAKRSTRVVLALGEVTGHAHVLSAPEIEELHDPDLERRFLRVLGEGGLLTHEEHGTITIPPGDYEVVRQREYSPEATRMVVD